MGLCQTLDVASTRARFGALAVAVAGFTAISANVLGGPGQPQVVPPGSSPAAPHQLSLPRLEEIAPLIEDVELKPGTPYMEVFVTGLAHLDCYDVREFHVEFLEAEKKTRIVPRFRRSNSFKPCRLGLKTFRDKAADLDPALPTSQEVEVLGFRGLHVRRPKP